MNRSRLQILFEDNHLLAVVKPAGLATMGVGAGKMSLLTLAKQYIKARYRKPGNVYLGVVSRIDEPVSGVVVFARTSKAAARLSRQFHNRAVEKVYWAIIDGKISPPSDEWVDFIAKNESLRRMIRVGSNVPGAQEARLAYRLLREVPNGSLIEVRPETGRKHQIRVQFSSRGFPILGDQKYGSQEPFTSGIALHARRLAFDHPISKDRIEFTAPVPAAWHNSGISE
ncbi:MAG TPA: RluA family pseudouridine synthase [Pirellulales bacterium]|nr:RluA family pseudouridine synthase [Pirellulales bacterium]